MQAIGLFGIFSQGTSAGAPTPGASVAPFIGGSPFAALADMVTFSQQAQGLMHGRPRPHCHHVRAQAPQQSNNADRIQGLDREIGTLTQQLAQYAKSGDTTSLTETQNLIQQDQVKQLLCAMGVRM